MTVTDAQSSIKVAKAYIAAANTWDIGKIAPILAEEVLFEFPYAPPPLPHEIRGKDQALGFLQSLSASWSAANFHEIKVDALASDPSMVIASYKAKTQISATGADYENEYLAIFKILDGLIVHFCEYYNPIPVVVGTGGSVSPVVVPQ